MDKTIGEKNTDLTLYDIQSRRGSIHLTLAYVAFKLTLAYVAFT